MGWVAEDCHKVLKDVFGWAWGVWELVLYPVVRYIAYEPQKYRLSEIDSFVHRK